ncbi:ABC transporter permease [Geminicoccus roseus]|uniref:ABC transporter permease n=1 Tax=Geminicoccus roseus TaxID=404900 RepID=UPI0003F5CD6B|nr:ABC transporter permease [Geminicoccus roseus]
MRSPIGPLEFTRRTWVRLWLLAVFVFLYAPIVVLIAFSFNKSKRNIVWTGFTTDWYGRALNNSSLIEAFTNSIMIALVSTVLSVILGGLLALGLYRFRFPGKSVLDGVSALPIVIPEICMGVALLVFYARVGWPTGLPWPLNLSQVIIGHVVFSFPFVAVVVRARMEGFDRSLEEASKDLGASEWQTFWNVTLPYMKTGLIAGGLLAMTLSLDDFVITFFTSGPETITFPVKIYSMVRQSVTPEVNAASTILIVFTVALTLVALKFQKPSEGVG